MLKYLKLIINLTLIGLGVSAYGQQSNKNLYLGASLGYSELSDQTATVNSQLVNAVGGTAQSSQNSGAAAFRLFGGLNLNDYVAFELGYTQTANETLTFSGSPTPPFLNYTGSFTAGYSGADLGVVLHPIQLPIFKYAFVDAGVTRYTDKQVGNASTVLGSYTQSKNQMGTGQYYGMGYDLPISIKTVLRASLNHYDSIGGDSALKSNLASIGVLTQF